MKKDFKNNFDGMGKKFGIHMDGLQHEMQQSRLSVNAGAKGGKTDEREGDATVDWENGDTKNRAKTACGCSIAGLFG